ncbi:cyclin-dependent protein kinase complex component [Grosmannia clavigera kw1407]|uniref:Cyclin-dependent protein kinase complex component n=1 Tax=Grosmannia clavigera (strain kw1407 / UAMH 11150) TaxID=655863 RepID=F0XQZ8_GROCL|nr:cyclin-dependent protein kinase complex component [Grosmannia clavigera kw1407]EFX00016.1 cyclin-dependent protein kinase complex component [Grosmannia clavigera kw1407]
MAALIGSFARTDHSASSNRSLLPALAFRPPQPQQSPQRPSTSCLQHPNYMKHSAPPNPHFTGGNVADPHPPSPPGSVPKETSTLAPAVSADRPDGIISAHFRNPSPPNSSSPTSVRVASFCTPPARDGSLAHMASTDASTAQAGAISSSTQACQTAVPTPSAARPPPPTNAIPSPASDTYYYPPWTPSGPDPVSTSSTSPSSPPPAQRTQRTIRIRSLSHIENLAQLDVSTGNGPGILNDPPLQDMKFEISDMPIGDIISMVAALLTKITTTNDHQHDALNRIATQQRQAQVHGDGSDTHGSPFSASVLAFHGKNVPAITILSYLTRIHKYCPTTYEVFLSLLVYFDRMTERVNDLVMRDEREHRKSASLQQQGQPDQLDKKHDTVQSHSELDVQMRDEGEESSQGDETDEGLADSDDGKAVCNSTSHNDGRGNSPPAPVPHPTTLTATYFVVDSFNIHRLIIAGVTCASKFFSDVFYTNSRYAKVGGLPLAELNHLELQFLILNDFRLAIPLEDLEAYATMLVEFYAREVIGKRARPSGASQT